MIVGDFSKWQEVFGTNRINAELAIVKLRETFARHGMPEVIVLSNCTQFSSSKFSEFCKLNGIQYLTSVPFNSSTNELAGNFVKNFKVEILKNRCGKKCICTRLRRTQEKGLIEKVVEN